MNDSPASLPVIEGARVLLRPIAMEDTPRIVAWRNDPEVLQNFIYRGPFTAEVHTNWMQTRVASGQVVQYIIVDRESGLDVGSVYFRDVDREARCAEYGIFIGERGARGKGLGSETAKLFTDFGFETLGLRRIMLRLLSDNVQAQRSYEKAGFRIEELRRDMVTLDGRSRDIVFMVKLLSDYEAEKKPNLVIIGANEYQNPLILRARELGYRTHVFAWQCGDVGEKSADVFYPVSIVEKERILELCRPLRPAGVCSIGSDLAAITVNFVAEGLGCVGNGMVSAMAATNKHLMRRAFERDGLPSCKSVLVEEDADLAALQLRPPLIVKPTDRSGSRGIRKVTDPAELPEAVAFAREPSFEKKVLVEEFAEGREYSVEYVSWQGEHHFLAVTEKFTTGAPLFVETGHLQPPLHMDGETLAHIQALVPRVLDCLGVRFGASHTELKVDDAGGIRLIECGARMGGDCIGSDLVPLSTGVDFVRAVIDVACGRAPALSPVQPGCVAAVRFIFSQGDLDALRRIEAEAPQNLFRVSEIAPIDGHEIRDSSTRYGYYILTADTQEEMTRLLRMSALPEAFLEE